MFGFIKTDSISKDESAIEDILTRGVVEIIDKDELEKLLTSGEPLRIKLGIDPTSPNIHIGRATILWKLKKFQELGHKIILIVGDFTGVIGDTSDKETERPMLSSEVILENKAAYFEQMGKIINLSKAETHYNSKWLSKLTYNQIGEQADQFSVSDFISRDNIKRRLETGSRVSLREVLYPLMQGYDSVEVKADVEIGGTDQRFNLLAGRTLQNHFKQRPQQIITMNLLMGLDGRKMSSSWGNTINITDSHLEMYGKTMRLKDELIASYFELATNIPMKEVKEITESLKDGKLHPKEAKMKLAKTIVSMYHGEEKAVEAEKNFTKTFSDGEVPEGIPETKVQNEELLVDVLLREKIVESKSDFGRLLQAGAIEIVGGEKITDNKTIAKAGFVYRVGKHRFIRLN